MTIIDAETGQLCMWVVYDNPSDARGSFVARMFIGDKPTMRALAEPTLEELRALLERLYPGLTVIPRHPDDEPQIVEIWL